MEAIVNSKADFWRRRIDAQRASGQSIRAWCTANDTHEHSFYWWRTRLGLSPGQRPLPVPRKAKTTPPAFARVILNGTQPAAAEPPVASVAEPLRLGFAGEHELILPASMPLEQVARLVHLIEAAT
jgi:hypothetical protein